MRKIQINTNLPPKELELIGEGLQTLAKGKREKPIVYENSAEERLVSFSMAQVKTAVTSLSSEFARILLKE